MPEFIQLTVTGVAVGCTYALVALGFVLVYITVDVVNFAQGAFAIIAAYFMATCLLSWGFPWWVAFFASFVFAALSGVVFQLLIYQPVKHRPRSFVPLLIATVGAGIVIRQAHLIIYGPLSYKIPGMFDVQTIKVAGVTIYTQYLAIIVLAIVLISGLSWFTNHTKLGLQMRATAQDQDVARLVGVRTGWIAAFVFAISGGTTGLAGILIAPVYTLNIWLGMLIALKAFAAAVVGGFGSVRGAIIGGIIVGMIESYGSAYISGVYRDSYAFIVLVAFLIFRPYGIFGEKVSVKV